MKDAEISWAYGTVSSWMGCHMVDVDCEGSYVGVITRRNGSQRPDARRTCSIGKLDGS